MYNTQNIMFIPALFNRLYFCPLYFNLNRAINRICNPVLVQLLLLLRESDVWSKLAFNKKKKGFTYRTVTLIDLLPVIPKKKVPAVLNL